MKVRSLGYRTDLAILAFEGSQVTDRGEYLVIRTPGNPNYWWGNFLLLPGLKPGSGGGRLARFAAEFPDAGHIALGLDETDGGAVDPGELTGDDNGAERRHDSGFGARAAAPQYGGGLSEAAG